MLYLTAMTFIPLVGALIILEIPKTQETFIKYFAIFMSLPSLAISIFLWSTYGDTGGYHPFKDQFDCSFRRTSFCLSSAFLGLGICR